MESQGSVERPSSHTPNHDNSPSMGADQSSGSIEMTDASNAHMNIQGFPVVTTAAGQQALMQQLAAASSDPAQSNALANQLAQAGLMQAQGGMPFFLQGGALPLNFAQSDQQQQQGLVPASQANQQQFVAQSPAHQNSLASGESPAPHTPSSHSLGSPQTHVDAPGTPRSETPQHGQAQAQLESQMQAQLQQAQMMQALQAQSQQAAMLAQAQAKAQQEENAKTLKPPKKPLTPYMRFSKSVWPKVKEQNAGLSVCEIGASIGKMWRELSDEEKARYNDDFSADKVRYDEDLQKYLKLTGLQASDLVKPRSRKKKGQPAVQQQQAAAAVHPPPAQAHHPEPPPAHSKTHHHHQASSSAGGAQQQQQQQQLPMHHLFSPGQQLSPNQAGLLLQNQLAQLQQQGGAAGGQSAPAAHSQPNGPTNGQMLNDPNNLPGFSQTWAQQQNAGEGQGQDAVANAQAAQLNAYLSVIHQCQLAAHAQQQQADDARQASPPGGGGEHQAGWPWHDGSGSRPDASGRGEQRTPHAEQASDDAGDAAKRNGPNAAAGGSGAEIPAANSAHSLYNSYGYNPWSAYPSQGQFGSSSGGKAAIDSKEAILEKEVTHLRSAVSEKTKEVERLTMELEKSRQLIEYFKQNNAALKQSLAFITTQSHGSHAAAVAAAAAAQNGAQMPPTGGGGAQDDANSG